MPKFCVEIPIAGRMAIEVDAADKQSAVSAAWAAYNADGPEAFDVEWEALDSISTGNVCHAPCSSTSATEVRGARNLFGEG